MRKLLAAKNYVLLALLECKQLSWLYVLRIFHSVFQWGQRLLKKAHTLSLCPRTTRLIEPKTPSQLMWRQRASRTGGVPKLDPSRAAKVAALFSWKLIEELACFVKTAYESDDSLRSCDGTRIATQARWQRCSSHTPNGVDLRTNHSSSLGTNTPVVNTHLRFPKIRYDSVCC